VGQFRILPVEGFMTDMDIEYFEDTFNNVFNAILFTIDGDTEVTDAHFVYQDVRELSLQDQGNDLPNFTLSLDLKYFGKCRYCDESQFVGTVNGLIEANLGAFLKSLQTGDITNSNSSYFQQVEEISFSVPELPDGLPPIEDPSIFDLRAPEFSSFLPWYLWIGIILSVAVMVTGVLIIVRDQQQLNKEDYSTGHESNASEEGEENKSEIEETSTLADDTVVSKGQSVNTNGMHSNYEVYVY